MVEKSRGGGSGRRERKDEEVLCRPPLRTMCVHGVLSGGVCNKNKNKLSAVGEGQIPPACQLGGAQAHQKQLSTTLHRRHLSLALGIATDCGANLTGNVRDSRSCDFPWGTVDPQQKAQSAKKQKVDTPVVRNPASETASSLQSSKARFDTDQTSSHTT